MKRQKVEKKWRTRASIPLPLACEASALPFELAPRSWYGATFFAMRLCDGRAAQFCLLEKLVYRPAGMRPSYAIYVGRARATCDNKTCVPARRPRAAKKETAKMRSGAVKHHNPLGGRGHRSRYLSHAKRALYHLS